MFIAVSVWGWYQWLYGGAQHDALDVTRLEQGRMRMYALAGWLAGFALIALFLRTYTNTDVPHIDGFLTAGSLVGQLLLSRKKVENWIVWIVGRRAVRRPVRVQGPDADGDPVRGVRGAGLDRPAHLEPRCAQQEAA